MNDLRFFLLGALAVLLLPDPAAAQKVTDISFGPSVSRKHPAGAIARRSLRLAQLPENSLPANSLPANQLPDTAQGRAAQPLAEANDLHGLQQSQWRPYLDHATAYNPWEGYCQEVRHRQWFGGSSLSSGCRDRCRCGTKLKSNCGCRGGCDQGSGCDKRSSHGCRGPLDILAFVQRHTCLGPCKHGQDPPHQRREDEVDVRAAMHRPTLSDAPMPPPLLVLGDEPFSVQDPVMREENSSRVVQISRQRSKAHAQRTSCSCEKTGEEHDDSRTGIMLLILRGQSVR